MNTREKGRIGEDIACMFLVKHGYTIIERNYLKKWGEIDIVAQKGMVLHFVEVKSVLVHDFSVVGTIDRFFESENWNPSQNVHSRKISRMRKTMLTYLAERRIDDRIDIVIDVSIVCIDMERRVGRVEMIKNVIF